MNVLKYISTWTLEHKPNLELTNVVNAALTEGDSMYGLISYNKKKGISILTCEAEHKYKLRALEFLLAYSGIRATHYTMYPLSSKYAPKLALTYSVRNRFKSYDGLVDYMVPAMKAVDVGVV